MMTPSLPRIVIVGGGAGGLELATMLGKSLGRRDRASVILVDTNLTHIWKPLLHEVAAGTINSYEDELNYFAHGAKHHFEFQLGRMEAVNRSKKTILLAPLTDARGEVLAEGREVHYDILVVAVGSTSNDFGTPGAREHCVFLDSRAQADRFQSQLLNMYLKAHASTNALSAPAELNIAIVGAGATGVELAAELHQAAHQFVKYGLNNIKPNNVTISIIEAADRILPVLPEPVSKAAHDYLEGVGIKIHTQQRVTSIEADALHTESGLHIPASLKVWSAGIKAPDFLKDFGGLEVNRSNQLVVTQSLQTTKDDSIFAMGDCSSCLLPGEERPLAPRAQVANQQAKFLVKAIDAYLHREPLPSFSFSDKGSLVSLSHRNTVGNLVGKVNVQGKLARLMYVSLYRMHQVALHGVFKTSVLFVKDMLSKSSGPKLKLH